MIGRWGNSLSGGLSVRMAKKIISRKMKTWSASMQLDENGQRAPHQLLCNQPQASALECTSTATPYLVPHKEDGTPVSIYLIDTRELEELRKRYEAHEGKSRGPSHCREDWLMTSLYTPLALIYRLHDYPHRTKRAEDADIVFLPPAFPSASHVDGRLWKLTNRLPSLSEKLVLVHNVAANFLNKGLKDLRYLLNAQYLVSYYTHPDGYAYQHFPFKQRVSIPRRPNNALLDWYECDPQSHPRTISVYFERAEDADIVFLPPAFPSATFVDRYLQRFSTYPSSLTDNVVLVHNLAAQFLHWGMENMTSLINARYLASYFTHPEGYAYQHFPFKQRVSIPRRPNNALLDWYECDPQSHPRTISVYFEGSYRKTNPLMHKRNLRHELALLDWSLIPGAVYIETKTKYQEAKNPAWRLQAEYSERIRNARFCICTSGDNPTSRRLYDALAAGCVPILLANDWLTTLPYVHFIPWHELAVILDEDLPAEDLFQAIAQIVRDETGYQRRLRALLRLRGEVMVNWGSIPEKRFGQGADLLLFDLAHRMGILGGATAVPPPTTLLQPAANFSADSVMFASLRHLVEPEAPPSTPPLHNDLVEKSSAFIDPEYIL
eukprot:CAMPEP_0119156034 /NCGR_PEP_ID=MMETSP1310-20130426/52053_1 /TAXON_ID=464262 /ORGANISM="Genus nov. species nov., Strain RCC2339" /LENGTH=606 /DNA_ID=CAMNT_0007148643 /DNA_START=236 /DNA_END=2056 /DNA_ORIENTATION=+